MNAVPRIGWLLVKEIKPESLSTLLEVKAVKDGSPDKGKVMRIAPGDKGHDISEGQDIMYFSHRASTMLLNDEEVMAVPVEDVLGVWEP